MVNGYKADHQYLNDASKYLCIYCFKIDLFFFGILWCWIMGNTYENKFSVI